MNSPKARFYEFGEFRFDAGGRLLLRDNEAVDITPKALDILSVLVEASGNVVSKEELIARVWPDSFVEEANLSYNIFKLRKALDESETSKFIETLPKRGYRFVAPVKELEKISEKISEASPAQQMDNSVERPAADTTQTARAAGRSGRIIAFSFISAVLGAVILTIAAFFWFKPAKAVIAASVSNDGSAPQMSVTQLETSGKYSCAAISPDGKFISYSQNYDSGNGALYVRQNGAGTDTQLLAPGRRMFGTIAFSPDSQNIYYVNADEQNGKWALYRIAVLGGEPSRLITIDDNIFTLSPDGKSVTYYRFQPEKKQAEIMIAALDGSGEKIALSRGYDEMIFDGVPAWSPDGKQIAFAADNTLPLNENEKRKLNLFTVDLQSGQVAALSAEVWRGTGMMSWMQDKSGIVMAGARPDGDNQLFYVSLPGGAARQITKEFGIYSNFGASLTADGTTIASERTEYIYRLWRVDAGGGKNSAVELAAGEADGRYGFTIMPDDAIVYSARSGPDYDLWMLRDKNGRSEGKPLTSDAYFDGDPTASPDGRTIVFVSDRAGGHHLFRIDADGTNIKQLTAGEGYDSDPDFSADGKWVVYASVLDGESHIWKLAMNSAGGADEDSADGGAPIQVTNFNSVAPSFSPDGKMIACAIPLNNVVKNATLAVLSAAGGQVLKRFEVLPFLWHYHRANWTQRGDALVYAGGSAHLENLWKQNLAGGEPKQITNFTEDQIMYSAFSRDFKYLIASRAEYKTNPVIIKNFKPVSAGKDR